MKIKLLVAIFFGFIFFIINQNLVRNESLTFDEPIHILAGNLFNQNKYWFDPMETPLIRSAVTAIANIFMTDHRLIILTVNTSLFALLGLIFPISIQIFLYLLILTDPSLVSYSHLFITDVVSSLFAFFYYLSLRKKDPNFAYCLLFFVFASASKVATLAFIIPATFIFWRNLGWKKISVIFTTTFIFIWWTYGFSSLIIFNHYPILIPFGGYLRTIKENILFSLRGQPIYFLDKVYLQSPWYKTFLILILKVPLPVLVLSLASIKSISRYKKDLVLWASYLLIQTIKGLNFGSRHLLLFNLIFIVISAHTLVRIKSRILAISLVSLQLILFVSVYPFTLSFANPYLIYSEKYLSDSDFDWGGGLLYLSQFLTAAKITNFQLAYNGNVDPLPIIGQYRRIKDNNPVASLTVKELDKSLPTFISVTCFHTCGYQLDPYFTNKNYTLVGGSFMYFHD